MAQKNSSTAVSRSDVIISGAGLVGLSLALSLARAGISVQLIDLRSAEEMEGGNARGDRGDIRATAVVRSSWEMFCALGLADILSPQSEPITAIEIRDGQHGKPLRFTDDHDGLMGYMVPNDILMGALFAAISDHDLVTLYLGRSISQYTEDTYGVTAILDDGRPVAAPLMVIAEGRASSSRAKRGFVPTRWQYDHRAIVATLGHALPHHGVAHELFFADGPLAMLPLPDQTDRTETGGRHRSSLVWSLPAEKAHGYEALSPRGFAAALNAILASQFGDISLLDKRAAYPLSFHVVSRPVNGRCVLIGDGAHAIHPIAGQGFNLGLRDVACLTEVIVDSVRMGLDCGDAQQLARYCDWRDGDVTMMAAATDGLTRLFGVSNRPVRQIRRAGMAMVGAIPALRDLVTNEARGESGRLPKLLQGLDV